MINRERALDYLNTRDRVFVVDAFAGWNFCYRLKCGSSVPGISRALYAEYAHHAYGGKAGNFGEPDYIIFNGGFQPIHLSR